MTLVVKISRSDRQWTAHVPKAKGLIAWSSSLKRLRGHVDASLREFYPELATLQRREEIDLPRETRALLKGLAMVLFGAVVMARALWAFQHGVTPEPITMGVVGILALLANTGVAMLLYRFRSGDANMRSVWLCSRNDAIGNLAVILAAAGVFGTGSALPDLVVALVMSGLALWSGLVIVAHARRDIGDARQVHQKG